MERLALVTGASSGIGRELAIELAKRSYDLVLVSRREDVLRELGSLLSSRYSVSVWVFGHDLSDIDRLDSLVERVRGLGRRVSVLVNNAGAGVYGPLEEVGEDVIIRIYSLNLLTPVLLIKKFLRDLVETRGCVVNIISLAAYLPIPWFSIYTSSKAALSNFTTALRTELRPHGVRVIGVYPGYVRTEFHRNTIVTQTSSRLREGPRGPVLDPETVAREVVEKIEDPGFNGDIVPGRVYKLLGPLLRNLSSLTELYVRRSFEKKIRSL